MRYLEDLLNFLFQDPEHALLGFLGLISLPIGLGIEIIRRVYAIGFFLSKLLVLWLVLWLVVMILQDFMGLVGSLYQQSIAFIGNDLPPTIMGFLAGGAVFIFLLLGDQANT